jgi:TatD DNase family protein
MWPPDALNDRPLLDASGKPLNHPANLIQSYRALASLRGLPLEELAMQLEENFKRLFVHQ